MKKKNTPSPAGSFGDHSRIRSNTHQKNTAFIKTWQLIQATLKAIIAHLACRMLIPQALTDRLCRGLSHD